MTALLSLARAYDRMAACLEVPSIGYSKQPIGFVIILNADGSVLGSPVDLRVGHGKKRSGQSLPVPQPIKRTSSIRPNFLWDKTAYLLGVTAGDQKRTTSEHAAFVAQHRAWLRGTRDEGLSAVLRFLDLWSANHFFERNWPEDMKDLNVVFSLGGQDLAKGYIHDRPAAQDVWSRLAEQEGNNDTGICLISGLRAPIARLHPSIKGVRGAQSTGASMVSFNLDAFTSYGRKQGYNAPISEKGAFAYSTALNHFLAHDSGHRVQIGDATTVFWADAVHRSVRTDAENFFAGLFEIDNGRPFSPWVQDALQTVHDGRPTTNFIPQLPSGVRFHVLGLAPNGSRLSVRFYLEAEFGVIAQRYFEHVSRLRISPPPREGTPTLGRILKESALLRKPENIQPKLAGDIIRSILSGNPYPLTLLSALIMRLRTDQTVNAARGAILKSILIRNFDLEVPVALDPEHQEQGYLLGRLFALYEQQKASALAQRHNSILRSMYSVASTQPRMVFPLFENRSSIELSELSSRERVYFDKEIAKIMDMMRPFEEPFPKFLALRSQAQFALGHYHQSKNKSWKSDAARTGAPA